MLNLTHVGCSSDEDVVDSENDFNMDGPSIYIMSPTSEESYVTNKSSITISGTAQDDKAVKEVSYVSDRGAKGIASGLDQWSIDNLSLEDGDNVITVKAIDEDRHSRSASITITKNQYLIFFGIPSINKTILYGDVATESWITVSIAPNEHLQAKSVRVIEINSRGEEINEVCRLYDDGDLTAHGDEIKGDNIFSAKHTFILSGEGTHRYRVSAMTSESEGEVEGFSSVFTITVVDRADAEAKIQTIMTTQKGIEDKVKELASQQLLTEEKEGFLREYLDSQEAIDKVEKVNNELKVTYKSGFVSYIELEENPDIQGGSETATSKMRRQSRAIPLSQQTRGVYSTFNTRSVSRAETPRKDDSENFILNKEVLIWAPFADKFNVNMEPTLHDIIEKSPARPHVTYIPNEKCTIPTLENLEQYGIIIIDTHGAGGNIVKTRHKVKYSKDLGWGLVQWGDDDHETLGLLNGEYSISTSTFGDSYYLVTAQFFRTHIIGRLPNSIVYNSSCESMKTNRLADAFIEKGARTYLGYKETTFVVNCKKKAKEFFASLFGSKLMTTGESYQSMETEFDEDTNGSTRHNALLMRGSSDMHYYLGLLNGDFDYGNMNAWTKTGDGRVITSLGPLRPTQGNFMGIVSTGLGYTESYGSIIQEFYVSDETKLSVKWNFLSEEFMEYVGTVYQDYLKISIIDDKGEHILRKTNIDTFASQHNLEYVSPQISFDDGDVYMTGWGKSTYDISAYQGKYVTLVIESGDVGDSVFDSATLLDEITIY